MRLIHVAVLSTINTKKMSQIFSNCPEIPKNFAVYQAI